MHGRHNLIVCRAGNLLVACVCVCLCDEAYLQVASA